MYNQFLGMKIYLWNYNFQYFLEIMHNILAF